MSVVKEEKEGKKELSDNIKLDFLPKRRGFLRVATVASLVSSSPLPRQISYSAPKVILGPDHLVGINVYLQPQH